MIKLLSDNFLKNLYILYVIFNLLIPSGYFYFLISFFCWNEVRKQEIINKGRR